VPRQTTRPDNTSPINQEALDVIRGGSEGPRFEQYHRSLLGEILDWLLGPLFLLWPMSVAITYVVAQNISNTPYDAGLSNALTILEQQLQVENYKLVLDIPAAAKMALRAIENDGVFWKAVGPAGQNLGGDAELPTPTRTPSEQANTVYFQNKTLRDFEIRIAYKWVEQASLGNGSILLVAAESTERRTQLANDIIKGVIMPQFFVLPIAALLIWFGLSRGIAPLNALQRRLRARRPDDLSDIDERGAPAEIIPLMNAINDLLKRLSNNIETQRRFVADAAHQLKTPLAGLHTQAELALRDATNTNVQTSLEQILAGTTRATRLVNQLLLMARAENPEGVISLFELDLTHLAQETTLAWVDEAIRRGIDLGFESNDKPVWVRGQPLLLAEALNNLIDNALRYTPTNGRVTVSIGESDAVAILSVEDSGPGIPLQERTRIFDRFYRVLGTNVDGSGLGLAIVKEILQHHSGTVEIKDPIVSGDIQSGTRFELRLPISKP